MSFFNFIRPAVGLRGDFANFVRLGPQGATMWPRVWGPSVILEEFRSRDAPPLGERTTIKCPRMFLLPFFDSGLAPGLSMANPVKRRN